MEITEYGSSTTLEEEGIVIGAVLLNINAIMDMVP